MLSVSDFDKVIKHKFKIIDREVDKLDYIKLINELGEENKRYRECLQDINDFMVDDINCETETSPYFVKALCDEVLEEESE